MALRRYIAEIVDSGPPLGLVPALHVILDRYGWEADDGRADASIPSGYMLVASDVTDAEHALLIADSRITYLPLDRGVENTPADLDDTVASLSAGRKNALSTALESLGLPLHDRDTLTIRQLLRRLKKRLLVRQYLAGDDWVEPMDSTWGDLDSEKRARIRERLRGLGVDMTVINGPDTLREAIRKILDQDIPAFRVGL